MKLHSAAELDRCRASLQAGGGGRREIVITTHATCCQLRGSASVVDAFRAALAAAGLADSVALRLSGCLGFCEIEPMVLLPGEPATGSPELLYQRVAADDAAEIVARTLQAGEVIERLLYTDPASGARCRHRAEMPFYRKQQRLLLGMNELIDPTRIEDYLARGGYAALAKALFSMTPADVIREVEVSGLRGRGGGGFPTARKWRSAREAPVAGDDGGAQRYVICNGDEGDPGAFMDRSVMEGNPHSVLEGMLIGAYAVGASQGYIYVRNEYPLAVQHMRRALEQARERGLVGADILGSGFSFEVRINRGGGAFVCGESTALIASLEGRTGEPRAKYIHMVENGLHGRPTVLNNVETWANVPQIIARGGGSFAATGTAGSKGTKIFSLVGKVVNTGLVEVPMGIPLRDIIHDIGGGVPAGKAFKAVQTGGPSGGCIPEPLLDVPVDFDELTKVGSMMGSGGMIVMDEDTCMVGVARYFLEFLKGESCGKCTPCREGIAQMLHILERITRGEGRAGDVERLESLAGLLAGASLCALGTTAANPILSTLRYFRSEYEAHIEAKHCPARECRGLFDYRIAAEACNGCGACRKACPVAAIRGERKQPHVIDPGTCTRCGACYDRCRFDAVEKV